MFDIHFIAVSFNSRWQKTIWTEKKHYKIRHWRKIHLFCSFFLRFIFFCHVEISINCVCMFIFGVCNVQFTIWNPDPAQRKEMKKKKKKLWSNRKKKWKTKFKWISTSISCSTFSIDSGHVFLFISLSLVYCISIRLLCKIVYSRFTLIWSTVDFQINVLIQCSLSLCAVSLPLYLSLYFPCSLIHMQSL